MIGHTVVVMEGADEDRVQPDEAGGGGQRERPGGDAAGVLQPEQGRGEGDADADVDVDVELTNTTHT